MNPLPPECAGCVMEEPGRVFVPPDPLLPNKRLVIWGEGPGRDEAQLGRGFVGPSGKKLRKFLRWSGVETWNGWDGKPWPQDQDEAAMNNVVLCCDPRTPFWSSVAAARACMRRHHQDVAAKGKPWLICGANACDSLTDLRLNPLTARGSWLPVLGGGWGVLTVHPAYIVRGEDEEGEAGKAMEQLEPLLAVDVRRALSGTGARIPRVHIISTAEELLAASKPSRYISIDIEGTPGGVPRTVAVAWESGEAWALPWSPDLPAALTTLLEGRIPIFHNAAFDVPELRQNGVVVPTPWVDTIVLAAMCNPDWLGRLEVQVLTHVPGSVTWKGLVDHGNLERADGSVAMYRGLWTEVLTRIGYTVPQSGYDWYLFYNGLDAAWTLGLFEGQRAELGPRMQYYGQLLVPLQAPLLDMGLRGLPVDTARMGYHRRACQRLQRMASRILVRAASEMMGQRVCRMRQAVESLEAQREQERASTERRGAFSQAKDLTRLRSKLNTAVAAQEEGFSFDSYQQRAALLYDWYQLPPVKDPKSKGPSTNDRAIESLYGRMTRKDEYGLPAPTLRSKVAPQDEVVRVLQAMRAGKKWATWERNFLTKGEGEGLTWLKTQYSLHRSATGRLASGSDPTELEKRVSRQQLQNVPKKIRDMVVAPPGQTLVGGDWAGVEWAIAIWYCWMQTRDTYYDDMLKRFFRGEFDPHRYLASFAFGVPEAQITGQQRRVTKAYTHGRMFGGTPQGLSREAGHPIRVGFRVCNAHDRAFRPKPFQEAVLEQTKRRKYIQTPMGWRRWFWNWKPKPTEVLGSIIQATAADLCKVVLRECLSSSEVASGEITILTTTHDSIVVMSPDPERAAAWLKAKMEMPIPWLEGRKWRADIKIGKNWREVS